MIKMRDLFIVVNRRKTGLNLIDKFFTNIKLIDEIAV